MSAVNLHTLVLKGLMTKEAAAALVEDAAAKSRTLPVPPEYERSPQMVAEALKKGFS